MNPHQNTTPFANKPIRSVYDNTSKKWWFSATDICAALIDGDYESSRKYWKQFKYDLKKQGRQLVGFSDQLKLPAGDGKYYFTEVLDIKEVIYLIQIIPSPKADPFRLWLAEVVASDTSVEAVLAEAGREFAERIAADRQVATDKPYELRTTTVREFQI